MGIKVEEFQKILSQITEAAKEKGNILTAEEIKAFFAGSGLDSEQMKKVLQYLKLQGISIEGMDHIYKEEIFSKTGEEGKAGENSSGKRNDAWAEYLTGEETGAEYLIGKKTGSEYLTGEETGPEHSGQDEKEAETDRKKIPLNAEEQEYLAGYRRELEQYPLSGEPLEPLFLKLSQGDKAAGEELARRYLPVAAELAEAENCGEIPFMDLLAEANMSLVAALKEAEGRETGDAWIRKKILQGIRLAVEEQAQRNFSDDYLVSKVEKLERTVRELEDGGEGEKNSFSVQELSIILDMDEEEIQDILRLTGGGE